MRRLEFDDVVIDAHGNLIGRVGKAGAKTLVVDGHIDTVPVYTPDAWQHDPFGADIVDGHLYGRGSVDMKAAIAAFIHAGGELKRSGGELAGCVQLVVSIAEEMRKEPPAESFAEAGRLVHHRRADRPVRRTRAARPGEDRGGSLGTERPRGGEQFWN